MSPCLPRGWSLLRVAAGLIGSVATIGTVQAAPPARNLSVEMRVVEGSAQTHTGGRAAGAVTLGSTGRVDAAGTVSVGTQARRQMLDQQQRVLVLNGGHASLRLSLTAPVDDTEVAWTPWGPAAAVRTQWRELANGMDVRPTWPGGDAPVTLEIAAHRSTLTTPQAAQAAAASALPQLTVLTTVQVPMGLWVDVAQLQQRQANISPSGFGASTASRERSLQVRVSLP